MDGDHVSMPQNFRDAFHAALVKTLDWITHGGSEPECHLENQPIRAGMLFERMTKFDRDALSKTDLHIVLRIMGGVREKERADIESNSTYGNAAKHLVPRIAERNDELDRREKYR